jgi:hypothetical protein
MDGWSKLICHDRPVLSFAVDQESVYTISGNSVSRYARSNYSLVNALQLFSQDGFSRSLTVDGENLYCKDFCSLHVIDKHSMTAKHKLELGRDLTSDICAVTCDDSSVYATIRNGTLAVVDKGQAYAVSFYQVSASSMWDLVDAGGFLYAGNVEGQLLIISKDGFSVIKSVDLHRQNLRSVIIDEGRAITASQDKSVSVTELDTLKVVHSRRNVHKRMFDLGGIWDQKLLTVSYPCGEMKLWDSNSLRPMGTAGVPPALTGEVFIDGDLIYMTSRSIPGMVAAELPVLFQERAR